MDQTDRCCRLYHDCSAVSSECDPETTDYEASLWKSSVKCIDQEGTCKHSVCQCDKQMAECLKKFMNTFQGHQMQNLTTGQCQGEFQS